MSVGQRLDDYSDVLYEQPGVTGVLLGIVIHVANEFVVTEIGLVGALLFAFGTVAALWSDDWWGPAGRALSVAGAFILLVQAISSLV
jgi:hypothetical protein